MVRWSNIFSMKKMLEESKCIPVLFLVILLNITSTVYCQNLVISTGMFVAGTGGHVIIKTNVINNGSYANNDNVVVFAGNSQSVGGSNPVTFDNLIINAGSSTTLNTAGQTVSGILLSDGILFSSGNLTLLSNTAGTALIDGKGAGQVSGIVTMQRYLPSGFGYKYFSSPFVAATVSEFGDDMNLSDPYTTFYRYDENRIVSGTPASGWANFKSPANVLQPVAGYAINFGSITASITVDITGEVNNGSMVVDLYNHNNTFTKGFNLVGNPYPSPIDWNSPTGWNRINIDNALYFFNASTTDQYGGEYSTYLNGLSSNGLATNIIPSMQGFLVHVTDGSWPVSATLGLDNNVRINDMTHSFMKSGEKVTPAFLRLIAGFSDDSISFDPLVIYFDEKATESFDNQLDALKLFNTDQRITNFYSSGFDGSKLSINCLPVTDSDLYKVPLGLKTAKSGDVIFRINSIEGGINFNNISITDINTGKTQDLLHNNEFTVNLPAGDYQNRFYLNLTNLTTDVPDKSSDEDWFNVYSSHSIMKTEIDLPDFNSGTLKIYNLLGQLLFIYEIYQPGYHEFYPTIKEGIYIVSFINGTKTISKKLFFQSH
jgi:hypothetical protein